MRAVPAKNPGMGSEARGRIFCFMGKLPTGSFARWSACRRQLAWPEAILARTP